MASKKDDFVLLRAAKRYDDDLENGDPDRCALPVGFVAEEEIRSLKLAAENAEAEKNKDE
jgi:hypothetical protein